MDMVHNIMGLAGTQDQVHNGIRTQQNFLYFSPICNVDGCFTYPPETLNVLVGRPRDG